jgi:NitT/TauT family transport system ATP-binding protein
VTIHCQHISYEYEAYKGPIIALRDVSFSVAQDEFACIVGPSGCGKTTLLKIIAGLLAPGSGTVTFDGPLKDHALRTAMVFQELGLFPWMTVLDNVALGLRFHGVTRAHRERQAMSLITQFGLQSFVQCFPHELSAGMRQRVSLARAFVVKPQILLMDEPFASLDALTKVILQEELLRIWKSQTKQVIFVTHDIDEAILLGDRVLVMSGRPGSILADIPISLPRPRCRDDLMRSSAVRNKQEIWRALESEVRKFATAE